RYHAHSVRLSLSTPRPPHPRATVFPYTTLFRSDSGGGDAWWHAIKLTCFILIFYLEITYLILDWSKVTATSEHGEITFSHKAIINRKSTRLNSSHVSISYAVFCLKKKII